MYILMTRFSLNGYILKSKNHKSKPHIQAAELNTHIGSLVSTLGMPWILKNKNSESRRSLSTLVESMKSYHDFLVGMQQHTAGNHSRKEHFEESFGYREIDGKKRSSFTQLFTTAKRVIVKGFL